MMTAHFGAVSAVTVVTMAAMIGGVLALVSAGMAQVGVKVTLYTMMVEGCTIVHLSPHPRNVLFPGVDKDEGAGAPINNLCGLTVMQINRVVKARHSEGSFPPQKSHPYIVGRARRSPKRLRPPLVWMSSTPRLQPF